MNKLIDKIMLEANRNGYMLAPSADEYTYLLLPNTRTIPNSELLSAVTSVIERGGGRPVGSPIPSGERWITFRFQHDLIIYNFMVMKDEEKSSAPLNGWALIMIMWFVHGVVVLPGWHKVWSIFLFPAYYASVEALWLLVAK